MGSSVVVWSVDPLAGRYSETGLSGRLSQVSDLAGLARGGTSPQSPRTSGMPAMKNHHRTLALRSMGEIARTTGRRKSAEESRRLTGSRVPQGVRNAGNNMQGANGSTRTWARQPGVMPADQQAAGDAIQAGRWARRPTLRFTHPARRQRRWSSGARSCCRRRSGLAGPHRQQRLSATAALQRRRRMWALRSP